MQYLGQQCTNREPFSLGPSIMAGSVKVTCPAGTEGKPAVPHWRQQHTVANHTLQCTAMLGCCPATPLPQHHNATAMISETQHYRMLIACCETPAGRCDSHIILAAHAARRPARESFLSTKPLHSAAG
jgi:hypothetical protein